MPTRTTHDILMMTALVTTSAMMHGSAAHAQSLTGLDCMIEPHSVSDVSTREQGVLEEVLVKRGDMVKHGQIVAKLESGLEKIALDYAAARAEMNGALEAAQAKLEYAQRQLVRIDELYSGKVISFNEKDKAETEVRLAETELRVAMDNHRLMQIERARAAEQLELRSIRSPVDGVIVEILLVPGESVEDRAREIMTIAEVDPLNVEVILPEELFGAVRIGTPAQITPLIPGGAQRTGEVAVVDRTIDAASATFGVQLQLGNEDLAVPGGVRCKIDFLSATQDTAQ